MFFKSVVGIEARRSKAITFEGVKMLEIHN